MKLAGTWLEGATEALRPPPREGLADYLDRYYYLSQASSAHPGKWRTRPEQEEILNAMGDASTSEVTVIKSARVGMTLMVLGGLMRWIDVDPRSILAVFPTVGDGEKWAKQFLANMVRDNPRVRGKVGDESKERDRTILSKSFPGGQLTIVGANSGASFRMLSCGVVLSDEVDAYPPSAGTEGDPVTLAEKRSADFWDAKRIRVSTPLFAGQSRIEQLFLAGDQRRRHVPCPHCGHLDILVFSRAKSTGQGEYRGHWMKWPDGEPDKAHFVCRGNGCIIEEKDKLQMLRGGRWIADAPFRGHASFHIWAAYSTSAAASWATIAREWLEARARAGQLQVFVNTVLGETWVEQGDAPEWEHLYARRQSYEIGTVPSGVVFLTCGVDVQRDRFVYEVVGWDRRKRSWSIEAGELHGDTANAETYKQLDALLNRRFPRTTAARRGNDDDVYSGAGLAIARLAIDSGDGSRTQDVYNWGRQYPLTRVMACKGMGQKAKVLVSSPRPVDVKRSGKVISHGYKYWPIGDWVGKEELYGWLGLLDDEPKKPAGWCTFPHHPPEYFRQLTAEHRVTVRDKKGFVKREWRIKPGRENHWLDARVLARAAASAEGLDRVVVNDDASPPASPDVLKPAAKRITKQRAAQPAGGWMARRGGYSGRR